jgi:hypothetical protein
MTGPAAQEQDGQESLHRRRSILTGNVRENWLTPVEHGNSCRLRSAHSKPQRPRKKEISQQYLMRLGLATNRPQDWNGQHSQTYVK